MDERMKKLGTSHSLSGRVRNFLQFEGILNRAMLLDSRNSSRGNRGSIVSSDRRTKELLCIRDLAATS